MVRDFWKTFVIAGKLVVVNALSMVGDSLFDPSALCELGWDILFWYAELGYHAEMIVTRCSATIDKGSKNWVGNVFI